MSALAYLREECILTYRYVLGHEGMLLPDEEQRADANNAAMKKMATSNVLIVGMRGLGVEIGELCLSPIGV